MGWAEVNLVSAGLVLEGDFYISLGYVDSSKPGVGLTIDKPQDRSFVIISTGGWQPLSEWVKRQAKPDGNLMIRAIVSRDAYALDVAVEGLKPGLQVSVFLDGIQRGTVQSGTTKRILTKGGPHEISVEDAVYAGPGTRFFCKQSKILVAKATAPKFIFNLQYYLGIDSSHGNVTGTGWYDYKTIATARVDPVAIPAEGIFGLLGIRVIFYGWNGTESREPEVTVLMDGPKNITAQWKDDFILLETWVGAIVASSVGLGEVARHRSRKHSVGTALPEKLLQPEAFMAYLGRLESLHKEGTITDSAYAVLKSEYEKRIGRNKT